MRRLLRTLIIILLSGAMSTVAVEAQNRGGGSRGGNNHSISRPDNSGRPAATRPSTPATKPSPATRPGASVRPGGGNGNNHSGTMPSNPGANRPGNNCGANRPGGSHSGGNNNNQGHNPGQGFNPGHNGGSQPGHGGGAQPGGNRPGGPGHNQGHNPGPGPSHGYTPGPGHHPGHGYGAPHGTLMPPPRPYHRPVPPPSFRPYHGVPVLSTILGVTFGTAINATLNSLITRGYCVSGYSNNAVYLSNVNQLGFFWPSATMFYGPAGLTGSEFVYSTPYYDMSRYNDVYFSLTGAYGVPVTTQPLPNGGMQATWWGYNGQYVQLSYAPMTAINGSLRYYTTLSFGN